MNINKIIITLISTVIVISAIVTAIIIYKPKENNDITEIQQIADEEILDDCTDEYEAMQNQMIETNSNDDKVSPNATLTLRTFYTECNHTTEEYKTITEDLVNKTKSEIQEMYNPYKIIEFNDENIILEKEESGSCGEHYIVKDKEGKVAIYEIDSDGNEKEYEVTDISTEYLTQTDRNNIEKGITVYGKQDLNQLIEDFE